jgi:ribosomal protein L17
VFKASVKTKMKAKKLKSHIDKILPNAKWNFDLKGRDKILRIYSEENIV